MQRTILEFGQLEMWSITYGHWPLCPRYAAVVHTLGSLGCSEITSKDRKGKYMKKVFCAKDRKHFIVCSTFMQARHTPFCQ